MGKSLVIVESPAKAKTINKFLGSQFVVKSSVGHIRDLPTGGTGARRGKTDEKLSPQEKARRQLVGRMGVDPDNDWQARYEILPGKEKVVDELKRLAKDADEIYLATDLDREGEAIAWHLREAIGGGKSIIPSAKKSGPAGTSLDVPVHFKDAAFVRTHYGAMEVRIPDAPKCNEIVVALVFSNGGRPHARIGGLTMAEAKCEDGMR